MTGDDYIGNKSTDGEECSLSCNQPSEEEGIVLKKRQRSPLKPGNHHDINQFPGFNSDRKNDSAAKRTVWFNAPSNLKQILFIPRKVSN
ncbi:hypothetical protein [Paenibacillus sp. MDMC362]|uniref:hypothetical protein n=1 Tax=Paenibacillus sp. MDMC362 TaxID=2977365 RepID=UPI000DC44CC0|nr:hypothetical protein [Paenibacillus sp. MDMC362]RAR40884.1 hypothetical protein DP091_26900 [Paenibacillus sp. MDMC362]